jgi:hypothetical protein
VFSLVDENILEASLSTCEHTPPIVSIIRTNSGYKVECLDCGVVSPERENPAQAWLALRWPRVRRAAGLHPSGTGLARR